MDGCRNGLGVLVWKSFSTERKMCVWVEGKGGCTFVCTCGRKMW